MEKLTQKLFIDKIVKSKDITIKELSKVLKLEPSSLRMTLLRNNLMLNQFCEIYEYIYKEQYKTGDEFIDTMREVYNLPLQSVVSIMENNKTPIIVTLYKKTKIRLINPVK